MTLSEALLIDAIWWFDNTKELNYQSSRMVNPVREDWGWKFMDGEEVEVYFNLLIREAIKDDIP